MKSIHDNRLENTRQLAGGFETLSSFADFINKPADLVSRYIGSNPTKKIGEKMARHIEACFKLTPHSLDQEGMGMHKSRDDGNGKVSDLPAVYKALLEADELALMRQLNEALLTKQLDDKDIELLRSLIRRLKQTP